MASRQRRLFKELGLLIETPQANPYSELGLHPDLVGDLLKEDPSGEALRVIAAGMWRVLSRRYHTDVSGTGDSDRFQRLESANNRIGGALPATLHRWVEERKEAASHNAQLQAQQEAFVQQAAELVRKNMELGGHPLHFSQTKWSQGVLLRRRAGALLLREYPEGGVHIVPGRKPNIDNTLTSSDFHFFMTQHRSFGLEPGTKIATYSDGLGRASILTSELDFVMDISDPVHDHGGERHSSSDSNFWARSDSPSLLVTQVPGSKLDTDHSKTRLTLFPQEVGKAGSRNMVWSLGMEVAGTVEDTSFYKRSQHSGAVGAAALRGASSRATANHFGLFATSAAEIVALGAGYSPLLAPGNSLLLYDSTHNTPVITDASVIGMLGNGAQTS